MYALCPPGHPLRYLPGIARCFDYHSLRPQRSLAAAIHSSSADILLPADDRALFEFQQLAMNNINALALYTHSIGKITDHLDIADRVALGHLAQQSGIAMARTTAVNSLDHARSAARDLGYPAVLKRDGTWGGNGVVIVRNEPELDAAYALLDRPLTRATQWKRRLVNGDRLALAANQNHAALSLQRHIEGRPANAMFAAHHGRILADYQVVVCASQGPTGAAIIVRKIDDSRIRQAGEKLAAALKLSGFFGLDFILETSSSTPFLIELNPRTTQLGHLPLADGSDLAAHMYAAWSGAPLEHTSPGPRSGSIAFYPQALQHAGASATASLDLPHERELRACLERTSWPERRFIARAYHAFRKRKIAPVHIYDDEPSTDFYPAGQPLPSPGAIAFSSQTQSSDATA